MGAEDTNSKSTETGKDDPSTVDDGHLKEGVTPDGSKPAEGGDKSTEDTAGLKKALAATRKERDELHKQIRDGELAKLPELERYKSLSEELTKENTELKRENMQRRVAMELGLPWKIGKRLTGETEDEMRADGADLAKDYRIEQKNTIPPDTKNQRTTKDTHKTGGAGKPGMNEALRALAGRSL